MPGRNIEGQGVGLLYRQSALIDCLQLHTQFAPWVCSARLITMNERAIKRLLIIFAVSLIAIFLVKTVISKTIINLNKVAAEKKQETIKPPAELQTAATSSDAAIIPETPAASTVVEAAPLEPGYSSGVSEAR